MLRGNGSFLKRRRFQTQEQHMPGPESLAAESLMPLPSPALPSSAVLRGSPTSRSRKDLGGLGLGGSPIGLTTLEMDLV